MRRGLTLIETLIGTLVVSVIMTGLLQAFISVWNAQTFATRMPRVQEDARQMALTLAASLRRATLCTAGESSGSACTTNAAVENASATGITVYQRASGSLVKMAYAVSGGNFQVTTGGTTTALYAGASVAMTYYTSASYRATSLTSYTPTSSTTKNLVAVEIQTSITRNGIAGTYSTLVRLRNSPKKLAAIE